MRDLPSAISADVRDVTSLVNEHLPAVCASK